MNKNNSNSKNRELAYNGIGSGGGSSDVYSTEEKVIGKWVDGSNVYEKTIINTTSATPNEAKTLDTLSGFTKLISLTGSINGAVPVVHINPNEDADKPVFSSWAMTYVTAGGEVKNKTRYYTNTEIIVTVRYLK